MLYLNSAIADRLNIDLMMCFDEGVKDGITEAFEVTDGDLPASVKLDAIWDAIRLAPSSTVQNVYTFAGSDYDMDSTTGDEEPIFDDQMYEQYIVNGRYKKRVLKVDLVDFSDDKIHRYQAKFHAAGTAAIVKPYRYLAKTIQTGKAGGAGNVILSGIDAQPFWGPHYTVPKAGGSAGTWTNDLVRPQGLTGATLEEMISTMETFPGEDGYPVGSRPTHLAVGTMDRWQAVDSLFLDRPTTNGGGQSRTRGALKLIYVPQWTDGTCVMFDAHNSLERGFIFQEREVNRLLPLFSDPDNPLVRERGYMSWQVQGRWEAGVGHPRRALRLRRT